MKILFGGDVVLDKEIKYDNDIDNLFNSHDYRIVNLESPLCERCTPILKCGPHLYGKPSNLNSLRKIINCVGISNNHIMDQGEEGLKNTIKLLSDANIKHAGAGENIDAAFEPLKLEDKVFVFCISEHEFGGALKDKAGTATSDNIRKIYSIISEYKTRGKVIIFYHGGSEIIPVPQKYLKEKIKLFTDFGADFVICHHPHVVQGKEDGIYYSLGNLFFDHHSFKEYKNSDWSVLVSYDTESGRLAEYFCTAKNGILKLAPEKKQEFEFLSKIITSQDYESVSSNIDLELFRRWYPKELQAIGGVPVILHYFRCEAHRENIIKGMSFLNREWHNSLPSLFDVRVENVDSFLISDKHES